MKERPILFSAPMVRAILDGRKTQTRRVVKPQPFSSHGLQPMWGESPDTPPVAFGTPYLWREVGPDYPDDESDDRRCPFGQPGDRLWVRETALYLSIAGGPDRDVMYADHADYDICYPSKDSKFDLGWHVGSSIHMPRWASRITLEVTGVRVERVQDISEDDAIAEGLVRQEHATPQFWEGAPHPIKGTPKVFTLPTQAFASRWNALNAKRGYSFESNPWVWVIEFKRAEA